jgi:hypothetical protein
MLVVDDVERVEHRFGAAIGTPQRDENANDRAEPEFASAGGDKLLELVAQDVHPAARHNARERIELPRNGGGVGDQTIDRDDGGQAGKIARMA